MAKRKKYVLHETKESRMDRIQRAKVQQVFEVLDMYDDHPAMDDDDILPW
jgi:hypothetical protein